jgi:hypothetical protein
MSDFLIGKNFVIVPKVTTAQRNALSATNGMLVYDSDLNLFYKYENGSWSSFAGGGSSAWGSITGTLSNQTDLQNALNAKQDSLGFTAENVGNKQTDLTASATKYPTVDAVNTGLATKFITIPFHSNAFNPLDATNYFLGGITNLLAPSTTNTDQDFTIGFAGTIIGCVIQVHGNSVVGSNEDVTLSLRNNTANTTTTIGVFKTNATSTTTLSRAITGTSIAVGASDSICLQINGTWATNPQGLRLTGYLMVRI